MTAGFTFFSNASVSSTRWLHFESRGRFGRSDPTFSRAIDVDVRVLPVHLGHDLVAFLVHRRDARVEVAHVERAIGWNASLQRNRDAVDQPDTPLEQVQLGQIVKDRFVGWRAGVAGRHGHDRCPAIGVDAERRNLGVIGMRREHEHRFRQIGIGREQPDVASGAAKATPSARSDMRRPGASVPRRKLRFSQQTPESPGCEVLTVCHTTG